MGNQDRIQTSVRLDPKVFEDFKIQSVRTKISIQKLTERSMYLFLTDPTFKRMVQNQMVINYTGSI